MIFILGGDGFVGSAYARLLAKRRIEHRVINKKNYDEYRGAACDVLINANGNSKKFLSNSDPLLDFDMSVRSVAVSLTAFSAHRYVLLSTGDVYPDSTSPASTHEDQLIDIALLSRYGQHKFLAEQLVRGAHKNHLIVRMGGFVGPGLRKNAVFDMINGNPVWLSAESRLQFISTDRAAALVWRLVEQDVQGEVVNLGARGVVHLAELHRRTKSNSEFKPDAPLIRYELDLTKLTSLAASQIPTSISEVETFVADIVPRVQDFMRT
jgi:nucleoside-diphosphate-sugar epimerase